MGGNSEECTPTYAQLQRNDCSPHVTVCGGYGPYQEQVCWPSKSGPRGAGFVLVETQHPASARFPHGQRLQEMPRQRSEAFAALAMESALMPAVRLSNGGRRSSRLRNLTPTE